MRKPRNESKRKIRWRTFWLSHSVVPYKTTSGKILTYDAVRVLISCVYDVDDNFYHGYPVLTNHLDAYLGEGKCGHPLNHVEIFSALQYLQDAGLIEQLRGRSDDFSFRATHEGIHYFELRRKNFRYLFFTSILLPIIVSVVTTLLAFQWENSQDTRPEESIETIITTK